MKNGRFSGKNTSNRHEHDVQVVVVVPEVGGGRLAGGHAVARLALDEVADAQQSLRGCAVHEVEEGGRIGDAGNADDRRVGCGRHRGEQQTDCRHRRRPRSVRGHHRVGMPPASSSTPDRHPLG
jgi:hypothetical protein